jgi:hypothetical protein
VAGEGGNYGLHGQGDIGAYGAGNEYGVEGLSGSGIGVYGINIGSGNYGYLGTDSCGVFGYSDTSYAGYFDGAVKVSGDVEVGGTIDVGNNTFIGNSLSVGNDAHASGENSAAMGFGADASGYSSMAIGQNCWASENYSVAIGHNAGAAASDAIVIGQGEGYFDPLINNIPNSLMIGFGLDVPETDPPTLFVGGANHRVGIKTVNPETELEVLGAVKMTGFKMPTGAFDNYVLTSDSLGVGTWRSAVVVTDSDWTISGNDIYSSVSGNVGIGTMAPTKKLEVDGSCKFNRTAGSGELVLRTPTHNDGGRYKIRFDNNNLAPFVGDDTEDQTFSFMTDFSGVRSYNAHLRVHGQAAASWDTYLEMMHDGTDGKITTDVGDIALSPANKLDVRDSSTNTRFQIDPQTGDFSVFDGTGTGDTEKLFSFVAGDSAIWGSRTYWHDDLILKSNDDVEMFIESYGSGAEGMFTIYSDTLGTPIAVFRVDEDGDMWAAGAKSALVDAQTYGKRKLYALESPEVWFEDFGSDRLHNGVTEVPIEPVFAATANLEIDYQVYLTPVEGWASLYVTNKTPTSFEVRDAEGKANIFFDYRIVAKRRGYEDVRLEEMILKAAEE